MTAECERAILEDMGYREAEDRACKNCVSFVEKEELPDGQRCGTYCSMMAPICDLPIKPGGHCNLFLRKQTTVHLESED